jgi:methyl-accepting chemotaxis protein
MRLPSAAMADIFTGEMVLTFAVGALFVVIFFLITAKMVFSRIYGPLKKMAASVNDISNGKLNTEVQLREKDEFQVFAADLNEMLMSLRHRFGLIKDYSGQLVVITNKELCRENLSALDNLLIKLNREVKAFKV